MPRKNSRILVNGILVLLLAAVLTPHKAEAQLSAAGNEIWHQDLDDIEDDIRAQDRFGSAVAAGDFNNDGIPDLAIGIPGERVGNVSLAGAVNIIYGAVGGLTAAGNQLWHQDVAGAPGTAQGGDQFGAALAAGDFNGDGFDDLAIGIPGETIGTAVLAGSVLVLYGTSDGLTEDDSQSWDQERTGIEGTAEAGDNFGTALAAGDFNNDGFDDLAIGSPRDIVEDVFGAGAVNVIYGGNGGLATSSDQIWHQERSGIVGDAEGIDRFGTALAAGDFNNDGFADLAIGVPGEPFESDLEAGAIHVLYGGSDRLSSTNAQFWQQGTVDEVAEEDIAGTAEAQDHFGSSLAVGDFNGDGIDDLTVGAPDEDIGSDDDAGSVNVIFGGNDGLTAEDNQLWSRVSIGISESARDGDRYGAALSAGDFNGDGFDDLAIGSPGDRVESEEDDDAEDAGAVNVLYGRNSGLTGGGDQLWDQNDEGIEDEAEVGDDFGSALAVADFNRDGLDDLAVGVPGERFASVLDAGAVNVIYGASAEVTGRGFVSAASFLRGSLAPGEIISIFAPDVGPSNPPEGTGAQLDAEGRVAKMLAGTEVFFDNVAGSLFFVGRNQVNVQVPYAVAGQDTTDIQIRRQGQAKNSVPVSLPVAPSAPALFLAPGSANRTIAVHFDDGSLNSAQNRASRGEIIILYATGEGQTTPLGVDGKLAEQPLPEPVLPVELRIGGMVADVLFAGGAPGFAGLMQINAVIPETAPIGASVPVTLRVGEAESPPDVIISVQ